MITPICSICCDYFTPDCIIKTTKCGHIFHRQCILRWLRNTPNCPECRRFGPVLQRVYLNFFDTAHEAEATTSTFFNTQQKQIETLTMKLSLEETKNKQADQRLHELERKLRDQLRAAKAKDEEHLKMLKSLREKANKEVLENAKKSRQATEEAEKLLRKEILNLRLKQQPQQKPTTSINIISREAHASTVIKLSASTCTHHAAGIRVKSTATSTTTSASKSTTSRLSSFSAATTTTSSAKSSTSRNLSTRKVATDITHASLRSTLL